MERPKVGVGSIVIKNNKILLGKRKNAHGEGTWSLPGGHLEHFETIQDCAIRETEEETGIKLKDVKLGPYTNDFFKKENKHYITLFTISTTQEEPKLMEPNKCEKWDWFSWDNLPEPLFVPNLNLKNSGFNPLEVLK